MDGLGIRRTDLPDTSVALYRREDDKGMNRRTVVVFAPLSDIQCIPP